MILICVSDWMICLFDW